MAGCTKAGPATRRSLTLALMLVGALALIASGAPTASAGPAEEEYLLKIPGAVGDDPSSPGGTRSMLAGGTLPGPSLGTNSLGSATGSASYPDYPDASSANGGSRGEGDSNRYDELLAKARDGGAGSGLLAAGTSAASKTPLGLAVLAALLLIAGAGALAIRRSRRANVGDGLD